MRLAVAEKVYRNRGNADVIDMIDASAITVLDVGCGAGDNAALLRERDPNKRIYGITASRREGELAARHLDDYWIADIEERLPPDVEEREFDCVLLSHVLEHVRDPSSLLRRLAPRLSPGGACVMAVPNVAHWRVRLELLRGRFEYKDEGVLDATHLRFFTYNTAAPLLLGHVSELGLEQVGVSGSVPMWILRRSILSKRASQRVDSRGCAIWPNLFGIQILLKARKSSSVAMPTVPDNWF